MYVQLKEAILQDNESPLYLHLGQVICRSEKMEYTLQKSVELGVHSVTPLFSERCGVKIDGERLQKKFSNGKKSRFQRVNNADVIKFQKSIMRFHFINGVNTRMIA